jgi:hypothetical protein
VVAAPPPPTGKNFDGDIILTVDQVGYLEQFF